MFDSSPPASWRDGSRMVFAATETSYSWDRAILLSSKSQPPKDPIENNRHPNRKRQTILVPANQNIPLENGSRMETPVCGMFHPTIPEVAEACINCFR